MAAAPTGTDWLTTAFWCDPQLSPHEHFLPLAAQQQQPPATFFGVTVLGFGSGATFSFSAAHPE